MIGAAQHIVALLNECRIQCVTLHPIGSDSLSVDAPESALTDDLIARLKAFKAKLLALLITESEQNFEAGDTPDAQTRRCGNTTTRDVPIHNGHSTRRECERCGRFIDFPIWRVQNALQNAQHLVG